MRLARDVRAFLFALVCGRHENGVGKFRIFWDFWELWGWVKIFGIFWKFGVKTKFFEFFGFQKGRRCELILY